jgi:ferritin-like metal-binding protein YciE
MADAKKDALIGWLRDAHAMESATIRNLEGLIGRADGYPPLKAQLQKHLDVSKRQLRDLDVQLNELSADISTLKELAMRFAGWIEPVLGSMASDDMPKHCIAALGWENFEIASYRSMLGAARELAMPKLVQLCERFIEEEREMANFLYEHLPEITRQYVRTLK